MARQRISFVIQEIPDAGEAALIDFLKKLRPTSIGVVNNPALLVNILNAVPEILIGWHRFTEQGEAELWTDDSHYTELIDKFKDAGLHNHPRAWLYVMNEPVAHGKDLQRMCDWMVRAMTAGRKAGVRMVMGNLGAAVYQKYEVDSGAFDEYLRKLHEWRDTMVAGFHEYGPPDLPMGSAGRTTDARYHLDAGMAQYSSWPSPWDVQVSGRQKGSLESNYYIGRIYWWDERSNHLGVKPARKLITEAGQDRLDDPELAKVYRAIGEKYPQDPPHLTIRGWRTLRRYFEAVFEVWKFPNKPEIKVPVAERHMYTQYQMLRWLAWIYDDTIYRNQTTPSIEGVNLFLICREGKPDWGRDFGFNYFAPQTQPLLNLLTAWTTELETAQPAPDPTPNPTPEPPSTPAPSLDPQLVVLLERWRDILDKDAQLLQAKALLVSDLIEWHKQKVK